jgi:O-antigen/teichoic acid export membrane protein
VWFKLTDKTYYGTYIGGAGAVLTIALNVLLIPVLGYVGCALATLACYFMMAAICWWLGERHFPVPYPVGRLLAWLLLASVLVAVGWFVLPANYWARHAWHLVLSGAFVGLVVLVEKPYRLLSK